MVKYVASLFVSPHSLTCIVEINVAVLHCTPMFDVILYQPEIPPNTGNIIRLCANTGARLHLVKPLGFTLEDKQLLRAGLDYHEFATITVHESWADCAARVKGRRLFAVSTKGTQRYDLVDYAAGDAFVFGPESRGLPSEILGECCRTTAYPCTHGPRKPEPQSFQRSGGGDLRSLATARI